MSTANSQQHSTWNPSVKLVDRADALIGDEEGVLKPEMHCGHALSPTVIRDWCIFAVENDNPLCCPVCSEKWSYIEVREAALLTEEERKIFEDGMCFGGPVVRSGEAKRCPSCINFVEREDETNLCVHCLVCSEEEGTEYYFCWNCLKEWKGPYPRSDKCDNKDCMDPKLKVLLNCRDITLEKVPGVCCPSVRACPNCWTLVEHNTEMCKNITCPYCSVEFCFLCLKFTLVCCKDEDWFEMCFDGIAPRQTTIGTESPLPSESQGQAHIPQQTTASRQEHTPPESPADTVQQEHTPPERPADTVQQEHPPPKRPVDTVHPTPARRKECIIL